MKQLDTVLANIILYTSHCLMAIELYSIMPKLKQTDLEAVLAPTTHTHCLSHTQGG